LDEPPRAVQLLEEMARIGALTVINKIDHHFTPHGVTAALLVSESHLAIHTWPEWGYAAIDVVSCKEISADMAEQMRLAVAAEFKCTSVTGKMTLRGDLRGPEMDFSKREL